MNENAFERDAIMNTQRYLRFLSYQDDDIPPVPIDGIWDTATQNALIEFQRKNGLAPTGTVDRETWELLKKRYDEAVALNSPPARIDVFPRMPKDFMLVQGDRGFVVDAVQFMISELEQLYTFGAFAPSGIYDEPTARLVAFFQGKNGISPTGSVNRETWDAMAVQYNLLANYSQ
jgi:peptidoglycan hydrolase-like protein with peptidoglycan-binding domain